MAKKTIEDIQVNGKKVLCRVDFNVPLSEDGKVSDDKRIVAALPTINYLIKQGCKVIIVSHLGRPNGFDKSLSMLPVAKRLIELVECKVFVATDVVGPDAKAKAAKLKCGQILVLENVRFEKGEEENDENLAKASSITLVVQINGKVRDKIEVDEALDQEELKKVALESQKVKDATEGKQVVKVIVVPKKLVNIVVN